MKISLAKSLKVLSIVLIVAGLGLLGPLVYFQLRDSNARDHATARSVTSVKPVVLKPATISGKPVALQIPSLGINLQVADGVYDARTGAWTLSLNKAHFATISAPANNEQGNTFIYGHYRPEVFARLHLIQSGAQALIATDTGHTFTYTFTHSLTTTPNDTEIFSYQGTPMLTIQTCSGAFMQNRQLFQFSFTSVK